MSTLTSPVSGTSTGITSEILTNPATTTAGASPGTATSLSLSSLKESLENLQASDESVLTTLNSVMTGPNSSPEMRQMALRFFQERQERESLLSQVLRAMGDTAMRIINNIR